MSKHRVQFILLVVTFTLSGSGSVLCAQEDFKGSRRAPNPTVYHRTGPAARPTINEKVETALEQGNRARDRANTVGGADDLEVAEKFYKKALALNPKEARAYVGLGNVEMDYDYVPDEDGSSAASDEAKKRAEGYYRRALELNPKYYDAYMGLAWIYHLESMEDPSNYTKSEQAYRQAVSLRPLDPEPHRSLGTLYDNRESDYSKAVAEYREAIRLATDKKILANTYSQLGGVLEKQGQYADAIAAYREVSRLLPEEVFIHYELGTLYLKLKNKSAAMEEYQVLLRMEARKKPDAGSESWSSRLLREINKE